MNVQHMMCPRYFGPYVPAHQKLRVGTKFLLAFATLHAVLRTNVVLQIGE